MISNEDIKVNIRMQDIVYNYKKININTEKEKKI